MARYGCSPWGRSLNILQNGPKNCLFLCVFILLPLSLSAVLTVCCVSFTVQQTQIHLLDQWHHSDKVEHERIECSFFSFQQRLSSWYFELVWLTKRVLQMLLISFWSYNFRSSQVDAIWDEYFRYILYCLCNSASHRNMNIHVIFESYTVTVLSTWPVFVFYMVYRQFSNIRRTQSQNINVSRLSVLLSLINPLKPCVKLRMKM